MSEFDALNKALKKLSDKIAEFPVGAISIDDLKPTAERIKDIRNAMRRLNSSIIILRAKEDARSMGEVIGDNAEDSYDQLQDRMVGYMTTNLAIETCLHSHAFGPIFCGPEDTETKRKLKNLLQKMYTMNDRLIGFEAETAKLKERETRSTEELKEALPEFKQFLQDQEAIKNRKLQQTNPKIVDQKSKMQMRVKKINVMRKLITNIIASSGQLIEVNPFFQDMTKKHRELVDPETIAKMALKNANKEPQ